MRKRLVIYILGGIILASSCKKENADVDREQSPVVSVKDKILYQADLDEALPSGLTGEDSINAAHSYIEAWINDQLMYDKASQNIVNKEEIETLVQNYRKSLITNMYQEQLLKEHFSKSISEEEIKAYYNENKEKFKLENSIIKGLFLKIPKSSAQLSNFQKWYKQGTEASIENIEKNTLQNVVGYDYFYDRWVGFDDMMSNLPVVISDEEQFLRTNKNIEARDSSFVYLVNIKEYKLAGAEAPLDYIKGVLEEIYIEQRKATYLKQVQQDLYDKGLSSEEIKFYNK